MWKITVAYRRKSPPTSIIDIPSTKASSKYATRICPHCETKFATNPTNLSMNFVENFIADFCATGFQPENANDWRCSLVDRTRELETRGDCLTMGSKNKLDKQGMGRAVEVAARYQPRQARVPARLPAQRLPARAPAGRLTRAQIDACFAIQRVGRDRRSNLITM